jgi:hypothetical protein
VNVRPGALACFRKNRTVARAGSSPARAAEAWALRLLGDVTTHRAHPDVATATAHDGAAMNLASELEMRPLLTHCPSSSSRAASHSLRVPVVCFVIALLSFPRRMS